MKRGSVGKSLQKSTPKERLVLFSTAFLQVALVSMNVKFISNGAVIPMLIAGFLISLVWTLNVKKVALGNWYDRFTYSFGALAGTGIGFLISNLIV